MPDYPVNPQSSSEAPASFSTRTSQNRSDYGWQTNRPRQPDWLLILVGTLLALSLLIAYLVGILGL